MFSQKSRAYDYRDPSIITLPKYDTNTHGKKCFMYKGAKMCKFTTMSLKIIAITYFGNFDYFGH